MCDTEGKGGLACELVVEVDYQWVVPPVKAREQMKETKEAHLRRTEEYRKLHSHDLLNEQRGEQNVYPEMTPMRWTDY